VKSINRKTAVLIATDTYDDDKFSQLRAPARDISELARVLADPLIGGFDVHTLLNQQSWLINEAIEEIFANRNPDDVLVLYFSCHGMKDPGGRLYFAAKNTKADRLASTGVSSAWVNEQLDSSRCQRVLVLLDCCYSGSYARGLASRDGETVQVVERLEGRGRAVITASDAMEYAYEGDELAFDAGQPSLFTRVLIKGLESGDADLDQDGFVNVRELYSYLFDGVRSLTSYQTPTWSAHGLKGELYVARNPKMSDARPAALAEEVYKAVDSELAWERSGAVIGLARMLASGDGPRVLAATQLLEGMQNDPDPAIRSAVRSVLGIGGGDERRSNYLAQSLSVLSSSGPVREVAWEQATVLLEVVGVRVEQPSNSPIVLLKDASTERYLPCWIGAVEATGIAFAQENVPSAKPLTHELFSNTLKNLGIVLERAVIAELRDGIFHCVIVLRDNAGRHTIEARASDAITLALRLGNAPILTTEAVMRVAGVSLPDES
jgi:bifunctional DNase/RNase